MLNKLNLSVGLVNIAVEIQNALDSGTKPSGKYVCAESGMPLQTVGGTTGHQSCGKKHANACARAIGYPKEDGSFFVPTNDFLESIEGEKDRQIIVDTFVPSDEVDPIYFDRTYVPKPEKGFERAFWLLGRRLQHTNRVAIAKTVLDKDEVMLFLRWSKSFDCLVLHVGVYDEQIKRSLIEGVKATEPDKGFSRAETKLADDLIKGVYELPFIPESYTPERWHKLRDEILANGAAPDGKVPVTSSDPNVPAVDLMAQLKATVEQASAKKTPAKRRTKKVA